MSSLSHLAYDARSYFKEQPRTSVWLRRYIGRNIIRILAADALLLQRDDPALSPAMRRALSYLRQLALEKDNG